MTAIRILSIALFAIISVYTIFVVYAHGPNFLSPFLAGVFSLTWQGQFNLDFGAYLAITAFWVAWRHRFSSRGLLLSVCALVLGFMFFAPYLILAAARVKTVEALLLGQQANQVS